MIRVLSDPFSQTSLGSSLAADLMLIRVFRVVDVAIRRCCETQFDDDFSITVNLSAQRRAAGTMHDIQPSPTEDDDLKCNLAELANGHIWFKLLLLLLCNFDKWQSAACHIRHSAVPLCDGLPPHQSISQRGV